MLLTTQDLRNSCIVKSRVFGVILLTQFYYYYFIIFSVFQDSLFMHHSALTQFLILPVTNIEKMT